MNPIHIHEYFIHFFTGSKILCGQEKNYWIKKNYNRKSNTWYFILCSGDKHAKIMCLTGAVNVSEKCNKLHVIRPRGRGRIFLIFRIKPTSLHNFVSNLCNLQRHSWLFFEIITEMNIEWCQAFIVSKFTPTNCLKEVVAIVWQTLFTTLHYG